MPARHNQYTLEARRLEQLAAAAAAQAPAPSKHKPVTRKILGSCVLEHVRSSFPELTLDMYLGIEFNKIFSNFILVCKCIVSYM